MTTPFTSLLPRVLPAVPGCPFSLALAALRDAATEFCQRTLVWRQDLAAMDLIYDRAFYTLVPPADAQIAMILGVTANERPLKATTSDLLDEEHPGWRALDLGEPTRYLLPGPRELRLVPAPAANASQALVVSAALAPAKSAAETEDFLMEDYGQAFVHGALAELYGFIGLSWANSERATHHARQFRAALNDARAKAAKSNVSSSLSIRPRAFGSA